MSMLQDLERGRDMEIEPLVGVVQELGLLTRVPTPSLDVVLALIRQRAVAAAATRGRPDRGPTAARSTAAAH
jgi:2-dehydropantoate 2-reductase